MSGTDGMGGMECERLRELAAELALGVLPARERAEAVAHLDHCPECREHVERLTAVEDGLLALLPGAEPPVGFESRVVRALGAAPAGTSARKRRGLRLRLAAVGAAAAVACGFGGWAIGSAVVEGAPAAVSQHTAGLREAALVSGGHEVGRIYAHPGGGGWVYMSVDLEGASRGPVRCELVQAGGATVQVGSFALRNGYGYWGAPAGVDTTTVTGARLLGPGGTVLATARFA
ncbi:zf-HC2 domain-containing protein [Streptomyces sp. NPDC004267]|uniref:zf-HC2 domain-containing protein n=1 Tax=Streptomyces sp. NPDC004267 TaxID=3364694 RepID=UPI0036792DA7